MNYFPVNGDHNVSHGAFYLMCTKPRPQVMWANKFCTMVPNIYWYLVWGLLHVNLLAPEILTWLLLFFLFFGPCLRYLFTKLCHTVYRYNSWDTTYSLCGCTVWNWQGL